jgi:hypothetical protein
MAHFLKPIDPGNILAYMAVTENEREDGYHTTITFKQ